MCSHETVRWKTQSKTQGDGKITVCALRRIRFSGKGNFCNSMLFGECLSLQVEFPMLRFKWAAVCSWKEGVLCDHFYRWCICQFLVSATMKSRIWKIWKMSPIICLRYLPLSEMVGFQHLIISICEPGVIIHLLSSGFHDGKVSNGHNSFHQMWAFKMWKISN